MERAVETSNMAAGATLKKLPRFINIDDDYVMPNITLDRHGQYLHRDDIRTNLGIISSLLRQEHIMNPGKTMNDACRKVCRQYRRLLVAIPRTVNPFSVPNKVPENDLLCSHRDVYCDYAICGGRNEELEPALCFNLNVRVNVKERRLEPLYARLESPSEEHIYRTLTEQANRRASLCMLDQSSESSPSVDDQDNISMDGSEYDPNGDDFSGDEDGIFCDMPNGKLQFFDAIISDQKASGGKVSRPEPNEVNNNDVDSMVQQMRAQREETQQRVSYHNRMNLPMKILPYYCNPATTPPHQPRVKSLQEMGYPRQQSAWSSINTPPKASIFPLMRNIVSNHFHTNIIVRIGPVYFNCHLEVLQAYSEFFQRIQQPNQIIILSPNAVTPTAFVMIYSWMLVDYPVLQRPSLVELFLAADYLQVTTLINQCWACMENSNVFQESYAFMLFLEAKLYNVLSIKSLMITRIYRFFLTLVSSKDYVEMAVEEVCDLLRCSTIGVNSEVEVFFSAIRWINYHWPKRFVHIKEVMSCVRFPLMPPWFLIGLPKENLGNEVAAVLQDPDVIQMITDGLSICRIINERRYITQSEEQYDVFLRNHGIEAPSNRNFVYDKLCSYHVEQGNSCIGHITYKMFLQYLLVLRGNSESQWKMYVTDNPESIRYRAAKDRAKHFHCSTSSLDVFQLKNMTSNMSH